MDWTRQRFVVVGLVLLNVLLNAIVPEGLLSSQLLLLVPQLLLTASQLLLSAPQLLLLVPQLLRQLGLPIP